jgi:ABC-2 type transport system ATP-binding protein
MTRSLPLEIRRVTKTLARHRVLDAVDFDCRSGEVTALLGPNGAGKTTTVSIVAGLRRPDDGEVRVCGQPNDTERARRQLALVPQEVGFPAPVPVTRVLDFVEAQRAVSPYAPSREEIVQRLDLSGVLQRSVGGLSGGQQRKLAVALGLLRAPELLVLDEATTNLDETARAATWTLLREYAERGGAVLVTSHILADIDTHADRVIALSAGRVLLHSTLDEMRQQLGGHYVSALLTPAARGEFLSRCAQSGLAEAVCASPSRPDAVVVRTRTPMAVVAELARCDNAATDLEVRPIPLADLLEHLSLDAS